MESKINILAFEPEHAPAFRDLNYEWLEAFFVVEPFDKEVLNNPDKYILEPGGAILMATDNDKAIGTVALLPRPNNELELTKMAVTADYQGKGIGKQLMYAAIDKAREMGVDRLILASSRKLTTAIALYHKIGFREMEISLGKDYQRCDIQMELML